MENRLEPLWMEITIYFDCQGQLEWKAHKFITPTQTSELISRKKIYFEWEIRFRNDRNPLKTFCVWNWDLKLFVSYLHPRNSRNNVISGEFPSI